MAKILLLLVEDDLSTANMYAVKFEHEGFEVEVAYDGMVGYEKMKKDRPALVMMDIMMPNLTGVQALEKVKDDPELKHIPIVMLTNLAGTPEIRSAMSKGAAGYIIKSDTTPEQVVVQIRQILDNYSKGPAARPAAG